EQLPEDDFDAPLRHQSVLARLAAPIRRRPHSVFTRARYSTRRARARARLRVTLRPSCESAFVSDSIDRGVTRFEENCAGCRKIGGNPPALGPPESGEAVSLHPGVELRAGDPQQARRQSLVVTSLLQRVLHQVPLDVGET